jgi:SnoaL-like domain
MKPRWSVVILVALISLLLAGQALAWNEAKFKAEVQALLDKASAAFDKKDIKGILATCTPQGMTKYQDGRTLDRAQWAQMATKEMADWQDVHSKFTVEKVWPKGKNKGGAVYKELHQFTRTSDPGHKYAITGRFRVYLAKTPQGWLFTDFTDLGTRFLRDGKPYKPKAAPKKP